MHQQMNIFTSYQHTNKHAWYQETNIHAKCQPTNRHTLYIIPENQQTAMVLADKQRCWLYSSNSPQRSLSKNQLIRSGKSIHFICFKSAWRSDIKLFIYMNRKKPIIGVWKSPNCLWLKIYINNLTELPQEKSTSYKAYHRYNDADSQDTPFCN